jgi:hypothetical protein
LRWAACGTGSAAGTEPSIEVFERLLEPNLVRVEQAHRDGQSIFGEVLRLDVTRLSDQLHRPHRRLVVTVGEHVDVGMGDAPAVQLPDRVRKSAIGQPARVHQGPESLTKGLFACTLHRVVAQVLRRWPHIATSAGMG